MGMIVNSKDSEKREEYLSEFKKKFSPEQLSKDLDSLKGIKVLCIGDAVIDRYVFIAPKGRASKDPILSSRFISEENYAGGVLAVANHLSSYVDNIKLVTLVGDQNSELEFIRNSLPKNVEPKFFVKSNSPTTIKLRYLDYYRGNKLFKTEHMNDEPISSTLSEEITSFLSEELPNYDLVIVLDYDHGFLNDNIRRLIQDKSKFLSLNCQTNSANFGYHYIDRYKRADFITMNGEEIRLPMRMSSEKVEEVIEKFYERFRYPKFLLTTGKKGCIFFDWGKKYSSPILTDKSVDTIGAGDAIFAIASLLVYSGINDERIPFIANCAGGIDVNILGNKEFVNKSKLLNFIKNLYECRDMEWDKYKRQIKEALDIFNFDGKILEVLKDSVKKNQKIFVAGNGGSAATANHYVCDFSKGANKDWRNNSNRFKAICLSSNIGYITAISNDSYYEEVFKQQLINLASKEDIAIFISASGNSPNIVKAAEYAKEIGMIVIGVTGFEGGRLKEIAHYSAHVQIPSFEVSEDIHSIFGHFLTTYLKENS